MIVDEPFHAKLEKDQVRFKIVVEASRSERFEDSPAMLICKKAASIDTCMALIVARSNKSRLAEFFVGSCTSEVVKRSKVPVLVFNE